METAGRYTSIPGRFCINMELPFLSDLLLCCFSDKLFIDTACHVVNFLLKSLYSTFEEIVRITSICAAVCFPLQNKDRAGNRRAIKVLQCMLVVFKIDVVYTD